MQLLMASTFVFNVLKGFENLVYSIQSDIPVYPKLFGIVSLSVVQKLGSMGFDGTPMVNGG